MKTITITVLSTLLLTQVGCMSFQGDPCEDLLEIREQEAECLSLRKQIEQMKSKGNPITRTELQRRYEEDCSNLRYYRDEKEDARCGSKANIDKFRKENDV